MNKIHNSSVNKLLGLDKYIKKIIAKIFPEREGEALEGVNPNLDKYMSYYRGFDPSFHLYEGVEKGELKVLNMKSTHAGAMACRYISSAFANEEVSMLVNTSDTEQALVNDILAKNKFVKHFNKFVEGYQARGIGATVVSAESIGDTSKARVKVSQVKGDRIFPITVEDNDIVECAFVNYSTNKVVVDVHLRAVVNGEYKYIVVQAIGKANDAFAYDFDFDNMQMMVEDIPLFQIWCPSIENHEDDYIGASRIAISIPYIQQADVTFDTWFYEYLNGKKKRFMSIELTNFDEEGQLRPIPLSNEEIILPKDITSDVGNLIQEFASPFRVNDILKGLNSALNLVFQSAGLGDATFSIDGEGGGRPLQTATAVIAKESKLGKTILQEENVSTDCLKKMLCAIAYINNKYTSNPKLTYVENDIRVTYSDNLIEDTETQKKNDIQAVQIGAMSIIEFRSKWYGEDFESSMKFLQEMGLLVPTYMTAIMNNLMTPEQFVDLAYGPNCPYKEQLVAQLTIMTAPVVEEDLEENE